MKSLSDSVANVISYGLAGVYMAVGSFSDWVFDDNKNTDVCYSFGDYIASCIKYSRMSGEDRLKQREKSPIAEDVSDVLVDMAMRRNRERRSLIAK